MEIAKIESLIKAGLPNATVTVTGDGRHFDALVISPDFEHQSRIQRHRMVLETVNKEIASDELHALSIKAKTPAEAET